MITRIRIDSRATSMEEAERENEIILDHMRMAGLLEGLTPRSSRIADEHFGRNRSQDKWHDVGLHFEGRTVIAFDPEFPSDGGLKQFGYEVIEMRRAESPEKGVAGYLPVDSNDPMSYAGCDIATPHVMVLERKRPVTREGIENDWGILAEVVNVEDAEAILAEIRAHPLISEVRVTHVDGTPDGDVWVVRAKLADPLTHDSAKAIGVGGLNTEYIAHGDETLRIAAGETRASVLDLALHYALIDGMQPVNAQRRKVEEAAASE